MMAKAPKPPAWVLDESTWQPERNAVWESLFTVANGYLGIRGFPEEPFNAGPTRRGIYLAGVFDPDTDGIPELVNVTDFMAADILLANSPVRMSPDRVGEYRRTLDLKRGTLTRSFIYLHQGRRTRLEFERFASLANPHLAGQSITITPLDWSGHLSVRLWVNSRVRNAAARHLQLVHVRHVARDRILLATRTRRTHIRIGHACRCHCWVRQAAPPAPRHIGSGHRLGFRYDTRLECGQRAVFDRLTSTYTTRDPETTSVERCCLEDVHGLDGASYGVHRRRHVRRWATRWKRADIVIDGPQDDQRAVRLAIFHLIQACPPRGPDVSIAAKGLTGEGYRGHVFWDTEIFMLPLFIRTAPAAARRLLQYRCHMLDGARRKALANGYCGAMFPWESADTGDETCPPYVPDPKTGKPVRVLTGELQHHISADIVHGAWRYVQATGDTRFRERGLLALAVETARFWARRATLNRREGRYEIRDVIGPDEYHEHVDNNAFTNFMAAWNLRLAAEEVGRMRTVHPRGRLLRKLNVTDSEIVRWRRIAERMFLPVERQSGLWEQHAGFFKLQRRDPWGLSALASKDTEEARMRKVRRAQVLKQADVIALMVLFPRCFSRQVKRRNWDYYEPMTTHDSSLSAGMHSIAASDLGLPGKAYRYFRTSAFIDLDNTMGNTDTGLHCAAMGGTWQAVVRGFLGLDLSAEQPKPRPRLPGAWKRVSLSLQHAGKWYRIDADSTGARACPLSAEAAERRAP